MKIAAGRIIMNSSNNELPKRNPFDNKLRVLYMNKVQDYNNLNRTAGKMDQIRDRVPSMHKYRNSSSP